MAVVTFACVVGAMASIAVSTRQIERLGTDSIIAKATAILSRMEAASRFVAKQGGFHKLQTDLVSKYPDGNLPEDEKKKVLMTVPVYSAIAVGQDGAEKEGYRFRVAAIDARRKENEANEKEIEIIRRFETDKTMENFVVKDDERGEIIVYRPVRLDEGIGCLACHGLPSTSPFGNGKDILGYKMEGFKDGHLRGVFAIAASKNKMDETVEAASWQLAGLGGLSAILALGIAFLLLNGPLLRLNRSTGSVSNVGGSLATASSQLKAAALQLANNSQSQAAALEQSSASVEQITSMVESNAQHAKDSVHQAERVVSLAEETQRGLSELSASMSEIKGSNLEVRRLAELLQEIGQRTEVIDEIAFQTKILAFNAAVEAERAGEHGRGFSVVASEIGNLAKMSGASALDISKVLKSTVKKAESIADDNTLKVDRGEVLTRASEQKMAKVLEASSEILNGARQIMRASDEQATGLKQISISLESLNSSTQATAATSEEASSASDSLDQSAHLLQGQVIELETIVRGRAA
jgi:methyl-accepting chemotaxis protein